MNNFMMNFWYIIDSLLIPEGYTIEKIAIRDAKSMTEGYNRAIKMSDSKYKVYIHQDAFIINKNFIYDLLDIFRDEKVGMFGTTGCAKLPESLVWWQCEDKLGKELQSNSDRLFFNDLEKNKLQEDRRVEVIDGLMMVTQYDIPWREDIFDGWHFYDLSQCVEFRRKGFDIIVPVQESPWILHDCGLIRFNNGYDEYEKKMKKYLAEEN